LSRSRALFALATAGLLTLALWAVPASAGAEMLCSYQKLTGADIDRPQPSFYTEGPVLSGDGTRVVFQSDINIDGLNPDLSKELWSLDAATGQVGRLTDADLSGTRASRDPAVDRDGNRIAFLSNADLTGDNPDLSEELFLLDGGTTTQLTDNEGGGTLGPPSIDGDGQRIVFSSTYDENGSNPEGNAEIFLHEVGGDTNAITDQASATSLTPDLSDDGAFVAFSSTMNVLGGNADGNTEIFRHAVGGTTTQITATTGFADEANRSPVLDADGSVIAFSARPELDPGQNPGTAPQVVVHTVGSGTFTQVSDHDTSDDVPPAINGDGTTVAFRAQQSISGDFTPELWFHDVPTSTTVKLTATAGGGGIRSVDLDLVGRAPVFVAHGDQGGINPAGSNPQIFRVPCSGSDQVFTDVPTSHPFFDEIGWMAAARISTGFTPGPTYKPNNPVTRAAMSAFMYRLADSPGFAPPGSPTFGDVPTSHPFFDEIEWMAAEGITTGFPGGLYKPGQAVTRQAMSAFMFRLADGPGVDLS